MSVHLVTGYAGVEHIQSADQGSFNAAFFGNGQYVMNVGNKFSRTIVDSNNIRINDGDMLMKGRHIRLASGSYETVTIDSGTTGKNRNDLICMRYEKDTVTGIESASLVVIKGTESTSSNPSDPAYTNGNILAGATLNDFPLYRVKIRGINLSGTDTLFTVIKTYADLAAQYEAEFIEACQTFLGSLNILDSKSAILNNTSANQLAGALGVKAIANDKQDASTAINTGNIASQSVASATKATQDQSGNNIKSNYAHSMTVNGRSLQLKDMNGNNLGSAVQTAYPTIRNDLTHSSGTSECLSAAQGAVLNQKIEAKHNLEFYDAVYTNQYNVSFAPGEVKVVTLKYHTGHFPGERGISITGFNCPAGLEFLDITINQPDGLFPNHVALVTLRNTTTSTTVTASADQISVKQMKCVIE